MRSPEALRPLTLCNCDCKILTTAIFRDLHWNTLRCFHPSQRCISSRQMTNNILEIETTVFAHVACAPQEPGILLTDFAAAYPSFNNSWICQVLEKQSCLSSFAVCYGESTTTALHASNSQELPEDTSSWPGA